MSTVPNGGGLSLDPTQRGGQRSIQCCHYARMRTDDSTTLSRSRNLSDVDGHKSGNKNQPVQDQKNPDFYGV